MRVLFMLMLSLTLYACGRAEEKKEQAATPTNNPTVEEETHNSDRAIRYSAVTIEENCGFWTDCDFTVRKAAIRVFIFLLL